MSNPTDVLNSIRVEGYLFIPPNTFIKNPEIKKEETKIKITEGCSSRFDFKGLLIPSPINAHAHLDMTHFIAASDFKSWLKKIIRLRRTIQSNPIKANEALAYGIGKVFDITRNMQYPSRKDLIGFFEITTSNKHLLNKDLPEWLMISPHAPYSIDESILHSVRSFNKLCCMHIAESKEEIAFVQGKENVFEEEIYPIIGRKRGIKRYKSPVLMLEKFGLLNSKMLLIHFVFVNSDDIELVRKRKAYVVVCPRSNLYLCGNIAPVEDLFKNNIPVLIGTDGISSTPNLNLWEEIRMLFFITKLPPEHIMAFATTNAYKFLGYTAENINTFSLYDINSKNTKDLTISLIFQAEESFVSKLVIDQNF